MRSLLLAVFLCCTGFKECMLVRNPYFDQTIAANAQWVVVGTNNNWMFTNVQTGATETHASNFFDYYGPCNHFKPLLFGDPQVVVDTDGRFWFHENWNGDYGCLWATTGLDPHGPFVGAVITPAADGLGIDVTSDKVVLTGITIGGVTQSLVWSKAAFLANPATAPMQAFNDYGGALALHNRWGSDSWFYGISQDPRKVRLYRIVAIPPNAIQTAWDVDMPLWFTGMGQPPVFSSSPTAYQPDGSPIIFPSWSTGELSQSLNTCAPCNAPGGTGCVCRQGWIIGGSSGTSALVALQIFVPEYDYGTPIVANNINGGFGLPAIFSEPGAAAGCPTLAVEPNGDAIIGASAASPTHYTTAFSGRLTATGAFSGWHQMGLPGGNPGWTPVYDPATAASYPYRLDFCRGSVVMGDPNHTTCHVLPFLGNYGMADWAVCQ